MVQFKDFCVIGDVDWGFFYIWQRVGLEGLEWLFLYVWCFSWVGWRVGFSWYC